MVEQQPLPTSVLVSKRHWSTALGLVLYYALAAVPPLLKLAGRTRVQAWPWGKACVFFWLPWLVVLTVALGGLLLRRRG